MPRASNTFQTGTTVGPFQLLEDVGRSADGHKIFKVLCKCGKDQILQTPTLSDIIRRGRLHCYCPVSVVAPGDKLGSLTVISVSRKKCKVRCACGQEREYSANYLKKSVRQCQKCSWANVNKPRRFPAESKDYSSFLYQAHYRGLTCSLSEDTYLQLLSAPCHYCARPGPGGIDRKDSTVGYHDHNCVACCSTCNRGKFTKTESEWLSWLHETATRLGYVNPRLATGS